MANIKGTVLTDEMIKSAQDTEKEYGVPTSITLGQILLESGVSSLSGLASPPNYNLFGVKAFSTWKGDTVTLRNGANDPNKYSTYRKYSGYDESIKDHAKVLQNTRYTQYTSTAGNYADYAKGIQLGGYAQDKNYANKLINIIEKYGLNEFDLSSGGAVFTSTGTNTTETNTTETNAEYTGGLFGIKEKAYNVLGYIIYFAVLFGIGILACVLLLQAFDVSIPTKTIKKKITEEVKQ